MAPSSSPSNMSFCSNYLLLKPKEAGLVDIVSILFSSDIGKRKFVDCPKETREPFNNRWHIFWSMLVMKVLELFQDPLGWLGAVIEYWLNLVSANGGFFNLIQNILKGKMVLAPDRESAKFLSFLGHSDRRVDLDSSFSPGTKEYYIGLCIMASKAAYENKNFIQTTVGDPWKMNFMEFRNFWNSYQKKANTQAFVMSTNTSQDTIIVTFRGTEPFNSQDWASDFDFSWYEIPGLGRIHAGFLKALGMQSKGWPAQQDLFEPVTAYYFIRDLLKDIMKKNDKAKFVITGHSLGGALAALFPAILALQKEELLLKRLEGVYTYGQPRVGDSTFAEFMEGAMKKYDFYHYRIVYGFDIVPRVPFEGPLMMFKHFGTCLFFNSRYQGRVVEEVPDKNYFSVIWFIPKLLNGCWELIRSFIIPYTRGPEYRETGLMRLIRVVGLVLTGVSDHFPPDYVNSTRLGLPVVNAVQISGKAFKPQRSFLIDEMV